ncbi:MAG: hypothetical protein KDC98_23810, partial [Planctomycetes bacterium]|nr:hypothetical protein [Planctomycetota bacterium]
GGGGGGAIALRAGDSLSLGALGKILANGGSCTGILAGSGSAAPVPGGGGSGGSVVLQSGRLVDLNGEVNVLGGLGGVYDRRSSSAAPAGARVHTVGGNGGHGFVRLEAPGSPSTSWLQGMQPAPVAENVGVLEERDPFASFRSTWYSTGLVFGPEYARYEIYATVTTASGTQSVIYSDDPSVANSVVAGSAGSALRLWIQAGRLDLTTGDVLETRDWRTGVRTTQQQVGIDSDGLNGFRFAIILDRAIALDATIDKVVIVYQI